MELINVNNLTVNEQGQVSFSGLSSGIDFQGTIDAIMAARRIPADSLEVRISDNAAKITAYEDLKSFLGAFKDSLAALYGKVSIDNASDIFRAKQAFFSTSRVDGTAPSAASDLLGVAVTNAAALDNHAIEVLQVATAHKIGSGAMNSLSADLATARGIAGPIAGSFDILGTTINVLATDTIGDLRDRINTANTGTSPTGVTASVVSASATEHFLVLTSDATGTTVTLNNEVGGVLGDLGISNDGGTTLLNELQAPQSAQFYADGLLDSKAHQSNAITSSSALLNTYATTATYPGSFDIRDEVGGLIGTVIYDATDTLTTLSGKIDAVAGVNSSVVADGSNFRLEITAAQALTFTDTSGMLADLGVAKKPLLLTRTTNTVNDVFTGVTMTLFQAEPGTTIKIDVDRDLTTVKTAVTDTVTAYNNLKIFINAQNTLTTDASTEENETGILFGSRALADVEQRLSFALGGGTTGVSSEFSVLAQIGVNFTDNGTILDPLLADTLEVDDATLDAALLNNPDDVRRLFAFDFSSSDPQVSLLSFDGNSTYNAAGYTLNLDHDGTDLVSANIGGAANGADNGTATVNGQTITLTNGSGAQGLTLFYSGNTDLSGAQIDFTIGVGAQLFDELELLLDSKGTVEGEIDALTDQNELAAIRIDEILTRLAVQRQTLTTRFIALETTLATSQRILDTIKQTTEAIFANNN